MTKIGRMRMTRPFDPNPYPPGREPEAPPEWWDPEDDDWDDD